MKSIIMTTVASLAAAAAATLATACSDDIDMRYPPKAELPDLPTVDNIHTYNAPLYWSIYEYCYNQSVAGVANESMDFSEAQWDEIIDWVATELKPYGYDMVCTDGFIPMLAKDETGFMTHYGSMALSDLVAKCQARGLRLGVYDNPLWIHGDRATKIPGTDYNFGQLIYNGSTAVNYPTTTDASFTWAVAENPGCQEFIDAFFKHYADLGVSFIRMDFLCWYEDGKDRNMGLVGHGYGRANYGRALAYIAQAAKKYGIFTSLVMPNLYDDALLEAQYGNMVRIDSDTAAGGWWHCSAGDQGISYANWPNCTNMFDGFTYWSHLAGAGKVILDGDFLRLNRFDTDAERQTAVTLQIMAGGPVAVADQPSTIGACLPFYQNAELLALNAERFVGHPLSDALNDEKNQVWHGQAANGDHIVALFNRSDATKTLAVDFATLGLSGAMNVRDLWTHTDEGAATALSASLAPHACKVVRLSK